MSNLDLEAIKARADAATPGPWRCESWEGSDGSWFHDLWLGERAVMSDIDEDDAAFIAAARTDVPNLIAEVERLRESFRGYNAECHVAVLKENDALRQQLAAAKCETFDAIASYSKELADEQTLRREDQREIERLRAALERIARDHQSYEENGAGSYGIGVTDGHRCAANIARAALAKENA